MNSDHKPDLKHPDHHPDRSRSQANLKALALLVAMVCVFPTSASAQGATLADRKSEILTAIVNSGLPTTTSDPSRVGDAMLQKALAHYALNQNSEANALVDAGVTNGSGAMFHFYMLMYNYLKFGDRMDQTLRDKIKTRMTTYGGGITGSTQNHNLMFATAFTLARETWPDATFAHTLGYGAADPDGKQMIMNGMKSYVTKGCEECDSYFYTVFYLNCYAMISEFSKDKAFANMAKLTCDWFLLGAANNWQQGYMISPDNRTCDGYWGINECPQDPGMSSICYYLYFGAGQPFNFTPETTINNKGSVGGNNPYRKSALNCVSSYVCPDYIVKIAQARTSAFVAKETHIKDGPMGSRRGLYRTTYMAPEWGITGQKDVSYSDYYQKQMNRWFVRWTSADTYSTFNLYMPNFERSLADCFGRTKYEQVMQRKRTVIGVTRAPADYRYPFVYGLIPKASIKATLEDSGWLFFNAEKVLIAVKFARPYVWTDETALFKSLQSDGAVNGYIVETADAADYPGSTPAAQLVSFKNAIVANTIPDFSNIDTQPTAPVVSFKNMDGEQMTLTFSEARDENHVLNGTMVDYYGTWPLIDNPWAHQNEGNSILNINVEGVQTTYNFDAWSRSSGATSPDLYPSDVTFSQAIPTVDSAMTFTATIRNSGSSPSGPCSIRFSVRKADGSLSIVSTETIAVLAAGAVTTVTSESFTPASSELLTIIAEADSGGEVIEIEENNNYLSKSFLVERQDLALNRPITASTGNGMLANDPDDYTYWQSTALPATITVDLGSSVRISQIKLSENPTWATVRSLTLEVLTGHDGVSFATAVPSGVYSIPGNSPKTINLGDLSARFVRLNITACTPNNLAEIAKFQVYSIAAPVVPTDPPVITSPLTTTGVNTSALSYQITASNSPSSFNATGLPSGLAVNTTTGMITGTPAQTGTFNATISATNIIGTGSATLLFNIVPAAPVITSTLTDTGASGFTYNYQITASNSPQSFNATGLPSGLTVNTTTGNISGAPTQTGVFNATISATNSGGTGSATLVLNVLAHPPGPLYWDADAVMTGNVATPAANLGGTGIWNATNANWWNGSASSDQVWLSTDHAVFTGTSGRVQLGTAPTAAAMQFDTTGYIIDLCSTNGGTTAYDLIVNGISGSVASIVNSSTNTTKNLTINIASGSQSWGGTVTGNRLGFIKDGAGTLNMSGQINLGATYADFRVKGGGRLNLIGNTASGDAPGYVTVEGNSTLDLGDNQFAARNWASFAAGNTITSSGAGRLVLSSNFSTSNLAGKLGGSLMLQITGSPNTQGANKVTGSTNDHTGGLLFNNNNTAGISDLTVTEDTGLGTGPVSFDNASLNNNTNIHTARIIFQSATPRIGSLASSSAGFSRGAKSVVLGKTGSNSTILSIGSLNTNTTFAGMISEAHVGSGLIKTGTGRFTLAGAASYTGITTIANGTVAVSGGAAQPGVNPVTTTLNNNLITYAAGQLPAGLGVGQSITGTNIAAGATIIGIDTANRQVYMSASATATGSTTPSFGAWQSLPAATNVVLGTSSTNGTLDLNNSTQRIAGLSVGAGATAANQKIGNGSTVGDATLETTGTSVFNGVISDVLTTGNRKTHLKIISGALTLGGVNTYTGTTTVQSSGLLGGNGSLSGTVTMESGGGLSARITNWSGSAGTGYEDLSVTSFNASSVPMNLRVDTTGLVNFTESAKSFTILNTSSGISNFSPSNVTITAPGFTGTGTWSVAVVTNALVLSYNPSSGTNIYTGWANANNVTGGINGDSDNDGIPNGVEYGLNTNPAASDGAPGTYSGNVLSFNKRALTSGSSDLSYRIEISTDLGVSDPWTEVSAYISNSSSVISAQITTGSAKKFARLRVVVSP